MYTFRRLVVRAGHAEIRPTLGGERVFSWLRRLHRYDRVREWRGGINGARAHRGAVAMMCAEAVPWRCHRSLVADALAVRAEDVEHIMGAGPTQTHRLNSMARVENGQI